MAFQGPEYSFLESARDCGIRLVTSESILLEVNRIVRSKFSASAGRLEEDMRKTGIAVIPRHAYAGLIDKQNVRDAGDKHVLAAAKAGNCAIMVTGDKDLLSLKEYRGIKIMTTREALKMMKCRLSEDKG
ncbi:MAG: PIN domain-containing protein [Candidatus Micrarchaeota archaeon]